MTSTAEDRALDAFRCRFQRDPPASGNAYVGVACGPGFGGYPVSLVDIGCADRFSAELSRALLEETGRTPEIWICAAEDGASVTRLGALPASRG